LDHALRVVEARGRELEVTLPVDLEPAGVDVDHVGGDLLAPKPLGDRSHLLLGLVGDATHPEPEGPEGRHRAAAGQRRVLRQDVAGLAQEDEEVECLVAGVDDRGLVEVVPEVEGDRRTGVGEDAVAVAAQEERDRLVHPPGLRAHRVPDEQVELQPALVQPGERFAGAEDFLVVRELEGGSGTAPEVARPPYEGKGNRHREGARFAKVSRAREQLALGVVELDVPGGADHPDAAVRTGPGDGTVALLHLPGAPVHRYRPDQHGGYGVRQWSIATRYPQADRARADEGD